MKKLYYPTILVLFFGLHLSTLDILAQSCSQLGLPENAVARLCRSDGGNALDLDFSPDGKTLASIIHWPPKVVLWDIENKKEKITINDVTGESVKYSPDGKTLACGDVIYDAKTGEPKLILSEGDGYRKFVVYSPDGKTMAGVGRKGIRFWRSAPEPPTSPRPTNILLTDGLPANTSKASPVSKPIATSSQTVPDIKGLSYSPNGKEVAIACALGIWIYDPELNKEVALLTHEEDGHKAAVTSVMFSPDGATLASSGDYGGDNTIRLWDARTKKLKFTFFKPKIPDGFFYYLHSLTFSPDSKILVSTDGSGNNQVHLWDTVNGEYKYTLLGHNGGARSAVFSPDGHTIASAGRDQTIILWDFTSYAIVSLSSDSGTSPAAGEDLTFNLKITNGNNLSGYQATINFDPDTLEYQETKYRNHLSEELPVQPIVNNHSGSVTLAAISSSRLDSNRDGILATLRFKVNAISSSKLTLGDVILSDNEGKKSYAWIEGTDINKTVTEDGDCTTFNIKDINKDCVVNIQDLVLVASNFGGGRESTADVNGDGRVDIVDLVLVAGAFSNVRGAPTLYTDVPEILSASNVQQWLSEARKVNLTDSTFQRGILMLEQFLVVFSLEETRLLSNYPNPFNPETWIPYQLSEPAEVTLRIYSVNGILVRTLALGQMPAGIYQNRSRAAYWDGKNDVGEPVASGVYFYTLTAGDFAATRKLLIRK